MEKYASTPECKNKTALIIAREIMKAGDEPHLLCTRIAFKCGDWLSEIEGGGMCESSLAKLIEQVLDNKCNAM